MKFGSHFGIVALLALAAGCEKYSNTPNPTKKYGLTETTRYREDVSQGIALANRALSKSVGLILVPAWEKARINSSNQIPVYLVAGAGLSRSDRIFVPSGERFILVNVDSISELPLIFHETGHSHTNSASAVELPSYLGLIFLHEIGHIYLNHSGSHQALPERLDPELNLVGNSGKTTELAADQFAAEQIRTGEWVNTLELRLALLSIIWNFNIWRALEFFGSTELFVPAVYWDQGYSHPNLAFRMLIIADLVHHSENSHQMLKMFVEGRERKPWVIVLRPIISLENITKIAEGMGYIVQTEVFPDRTRFHLKYTPTRTEFFIDAWPEKIEAAIQEMAEAIGIKLPPR